ncbi:MAG: hypothetical protein ABUS79_21590 [Pseudomonadota bacterium]
MKRRAAKRRTAKQVEPAAAEPWRRLLLGSLPALAFLLGCTPMSDFDVWWHLRTGQLILQSGAVPRVDLFTYTNATRPWIDVHWLYQVGLASLYGAGGASALVLVKATAGAAIVGLSLLARQPEQRAWPVALAWLPGVLMLSGRLSERPELVSLVLLAVVLAVLARAPQKPRWLWLLPAAQLLWVNCHGFFVMGPLVLAAYAAEWIVERLRPPAIPSERPPARTFAVVAVACAVACLVNPYGLAAVGFSFEQFQKVGPGLYRSTIGELKSAGDFIAAAGVGNPYLLAYFASVLLGVASFVACARRGRFSLYRALLFGAGAYLGWQATRNNGLCAGIAAFVTSWNFGDAVAARPARRPRKDQTGTLGGVTGPPATTPLGKAQLRQRANLLLLAGVGTLAVATVSGALYAWAGEGRRVGLGERPRWYAHDACAFLARPDLPARDVTYNISQAAVCIAHGAPAHRQFMDPRLEVNTQETFERYLRGIQRLWRGDATWEEPLGIDHGRPDDVPAILIERGPLGRAAEVLSRDPRWRCVFADPLATVFVTSRFADQHGLAPVPLH